MEDKQARALKRCRADEDPIEHFEIRCQYFSSDIKRSKSATRFIRDCRYSLVGNSDERKWTPDEREKKLALLKKYFPERIDDILNYEVEFNRVQSKKEEMKLMKNKLENMQEKVL